MKKIKNKKKSIRKILNIGIIIVLLIIVILIFKRVNNEVLQKKKFENNVISFAENNSKTIFSIDKITFFSSCDTKNNLSTVNNLKIENLYTYTDIAIFINNNSEDLNMENTLKSVEINNIKLIKEPKVGTPNLYYKSINSFAKSTFDENNIIEKNIKFDVTSEDNINLGRPILYNNCANPITLSYINQNIKKDYTIKDIENPITYNGKLLERCGVPLNSLETSISFDIYIENNENQKFKTLVYFNIPYQNEEKSICDGSLTIKKDTNFNFYRYE